MRPFSRRQQPESGKAQPVDTASMPDREMPNLQTQDTTGVPAICYATCNDAYLEYQRVLGPGLCEQGSPFLEYSEACKQCLQANGGGLTPDLAAATFYCDSLTTPTTQPTRSAIRSTGSTTHYTSATEPTIPTSWLTKQTAVSTTTFTGIGLNSLTTVTTLTLLVEVTVTRADWTGFSHSAAASSSGGQTTGQSEESGSGNAEASQAWIAGPVIGGVVALVALVGIYLFFMHRRKRSQKGEEETWTGKPELHAESLPGPPKLPQEIDAQPRPPQELEGEYYAANDQSTYQYHPIAEMAANEAAAREMDVKTQSRGMDAQTPPRT